MSRLISKINKTNKWDFLFILFSIFMLLPFFYATQYALPYADDFWMAGTVKKSSDILLVASVKEAANFYISRGGSFLPFFLEFFLLGFTKISFFPCLHFILASIFIFFFVSIYLFIKSFSKRFQLEKIQFLLLFFILLVGMNTTSPDQAFYAAVCVISYEFFFAATLLSLSCFINYTMTNSKKSYVGAVLWGIIGSNMHSFAAILNLIFFAYFLYFYIINKRINPQILALFIIVFITALIVCLAPGNFARHGGDTLESMHFAKVFITTARIIIKYAYDLFENSFLVFCGACLFFFSLFIENPAKKKLFINPILLALFFIVLCYLFVFPICLGYSGEHSLPNRSRFLLDFIMAFSFFTFVIYVSIWLQNKYNTNTVLSKEKIPLIILLFTIFFSIELQNIGLKNLYSIKCVKEIANGNLKEVFESGKKVLLAIKDSPDDDVIVYGEKKYSSILFEIGLKEGEEYSTFWVNSFIADYYGKKSVTYISN